jgi:hypothetical protein
MKFSILALGAAVAGIASVHPCAAQTSFDRAAPGGLQKVRVASQISDDFFGESTDSQPNDPFFGLESSPSDASDPKSLSPSQPSFDQPLVQRPVRVNTESTQPAPLEVLTNTPEVGMVPVYWPQGGPGCCPTPNPVASMMMRTWCTDGLWATYPCQNAQQCQHIQQHTGGYNRYAAGCGQACGTCAPQAVQGGLPVVNAYPTGVPFANLPRAAERQVVASSPALPATQFELTASELPADVPTVPAEAQRAPVAPQPAPAEPSPTVPSGNILPSAEPSGAAPVIARLPSATLR